MADVEAQRRKNQLAARAAAEGSGSWSGSCPGSLSGSFAEAGGTSGGMGGGAATGQAGGAAGAPSAALAPSAAGAPSAALAPSVAGAAPSGLSLLNLKCASPPHPSSPRHPPPTLPFSSASPALPPPSDDHACSCASCVLPLPASAQGPLHPPICNGTWIWLQGPPHQPRQRCWLRCRAAAAAHQPAPPTSCSVRHHQRRQRHRE